MKEIIDPKIESQKKGLELKPSQNPNRGNKMQLAPALRRNLLIGFLILSFFSVCFLAYTSFRASQWSLAPKQRFEKLFDEDIKLLTRSGKLPIEWKDLKVVSIRSSGSLAQQLVGGWRPQIPVSDKGKFKLDIFLTDALDIESRGYSIVVEYTVIDMKTNNSSHQMGRTLKVGFLF
jgi:hypothetical protein